MDYGLKVIINDVELLEASAVVRDISTGVTYNTPYISDVKLTDNATAGVMQIGATPSDCLTFTIRNPNRTNYDGELVEFWISPPDTDTDNMRAKSAIEDEVSTDVSDEGIDEEDTTDEFDDEDSSGEDPTAEDLADIEAHSEALIEDRYTTLEGEDETDPDTDTDESEEPGWRLTGTYRVHSQKNSDDGSTITLTCYDNMQELNRPFEPSNATATLQNMFDDLRAQVLAELGISIDGFDYTSINRTVTWPVSCSYRDALGWFAGLLGAFATCGEDGSIGFSMYSISDEIYLDTILNSMSLDLSGELELDGIRCNVGTVTDEFIQSGFEPDLEFSNPLMTQTDLDAVLEFYNGIRFSGGRIGMPWDDSMTAGSFIRIMTEDEYANYLELNNALEDDELTDDEILAIKEQMNALGRVLLISNQVIDFTGDATTIISSKCTSTTSQDTKMVAPSEKKVGIIAAVAKAAKQIADNTRQYFWFTSQGTDTGAHISEVPLDEWDDPLDPNYHSGGNLLARSNGIAVRDGLTELATFGASLIEIGKSSISAVVELCGGVGKISAYTAGTQDEYKRMKLEADNGVDIADLYVDGVPDLSMNLLSARLQADTSMPSSYSNLTWSCGIVQISAMERRFAHDVIGTGFEDPHVPHSGVYTFTEITCARSGRILASAKIEAEGMTDQHILNLRLVKVVGGSDTVLFRASNRASGERGSVTIANELIEVDAGDVLKWQACDSSGSAGGTIKANDYRSYFTLQYVTDQAPRFT